MSYEVFQKIVRETGSHFMGHPVDLPHSLNAGNVSLVTFSTVLITHHRAYAICFLLQVSKILFT